ncbi:MULTISPECIES: twin-arginine translocase subunit TatC [unclassified Sporosarcina]|uniref:twin-arginine translocase subunit TatC n=1 Tax=unclassified Sporosarcina TaxID=2647733 RepID=UPI0020411607|nr:MULTISPECIES: twin-arginine translocase subunit TatC [unclassified Sporosarcina]GKV64465.1 sec-independent protein translocase protein TatC [Sporosarcina sp. NCCP-2331]GLB55210.1 sec-independent protein translocase protein TatC [Sporosarcina sp. NCCP-2378]
MDPYSDQNRKILSPPDEKNTEESAPSDHSAETSSTNTEPEHSSDKDSALIEHLTDLRKQLIKSVAIFLVFFIATFSTINFWFPYITRGYQLVVLSPLEVISFYTAISAAMAFGLSIPFLCHFLWQFVKPGLTEKEGRFLSLYSPAILILFIGGLAFGYYIVNPLSYNFLIKLGNMNFDVMITAKEYGRFLLMTTMPIGLLFELPIVALFLSVIGILTSESMKKVRKWSYVVLAVVSALITPPDFFSQLIILIPMIALYEVSIFLVTRTERRVLREDPV